MKTKLLIFFIFLLSAIYAKADLKPANYDNKFVTADTTILDSILLLNLAGFIGHSVDSLLQKLPASYHTIKISSASNPYLADRLRVNYNDQYVVKIIVKNFQHMDRYDANRQWNITQFKLENIAWIFVNTG